MAIWVIAVSGLAPCQCFSPGSNQTTSPGRISSTAPPSFWARPKPAVTMMICPSGWYARRSAHPFECDGVARCGRRWSYRKQRIDPHNAGEPVCWSLAGRLTARSSNFHSCSFVIRLCCPAKDATGAERILVRFDADRYRRFGTVADSVQIFEISTLARTAFRRWVEPTVMAFPAAAR